MATVRLLLLGLVLAAAGRAQFTPYLTPSVSWTSNSTFEGAAYDTWPTSLQIVFLTGAGGPYSIGLMTMDLYSFTTAGGTYSFTVALHDATDTTTSALAGPTTLASDTVTFTLPVSSAPFTLTLTAADLPNIASFGLQSTTAYAMTFYGASSGTAFSMLNNYGLSGGYTTTNGFTVLHSMNANSGSIPTTSMVSFGSFTPVPEPVTVGPLLAGLGVLGLAMLRRLRSG
ncbi:MAG: PEP-CTERM sorting domain-containing protein [Verrucomicrobia bacterium]|nr:PEP-CTERM sorting domain-containing protein [Verrucomicrobiota bacterium]